MKDRQISQLQNQLSEETRKRSTQEQEVTQYVSANQRLTSQLKDLENSSLQQKHQFQQQQIQYEQRIQQYQEQIQQYQQQIQQQKQQQQQIQQIQSPAIHNNSHNKRTKPTGMPFAFEPPLEINNFLLNNEGDDEVEEEVVQPKAKSNNKRLQKAVVCFNFLYFEISSGNIL